VHLRGLPYALPYKHLARFAGNLATCQEAGLGMVESLKSTRRSLANTHLSGEMDIVFARVEKGAPLFEAISVAKRSLPAFFVPMIEAGEQTGRLDESLRYIEHHCELLAGPASAMRNVWMYPLAILLTGTAIQFVAYLCLAPWRTTAAFFFTSVTSYAMIGVIAFVAYSPLFKPLLDQLRLMLPIAGATERDIAVNRFFHALAMLYAAAGHRVENMIRKAARTVANEVLQVDLLRVANQIEQEASLPDAFEVSKYVSREEKEIIATGDLSGTLERSFERIANAAAEQLVARLAIIQQISVRVMSALVMFSVASTVIGLLRFL
jgi:type II secretory pathway component PulF